MNIFVDKGYADSRTFCIRFLQSPEFNSNTLKKFTDYFPNKESAATEVANKILNNHIERNEILLAYAKQQRMWFTLKTGNYQSLIEFENPDRLLTEFGEEGWYGPIRNPDDGSFFLFSSKVF